MEEMESRVKQAERLIYVVDIILSVLIVLVLAVFVVAAFQSLRVDYTENELDDNAAKTFRTVEFYAYDGDLIQKWEGEIRIEPDSSESCRIVVDSEETIITDGAVATEEIG